MAGPTLWRLHGDGRHVAPGAVVAPDERLSWPLTAGIGLQHVVAMFGATFLVPVLTGFPPATTILFSGIGTLLFLVVTRGRIPSYLGSSFAFIAPVVAAKTDGGIPAALGGIVVAGALLIVVGLLVQAVGTAWIDWLMPPVVTGAIVALIGLNLAPVAKANVEKQPALAVVTIVAVVLVTVLFRGLLGRLSIVLGVALGWTIAAVAGEVDAASTAALRKASWFGLPDFTTPTFSWHAIALIAPVVVVLIAENTGHVKAVAAMTGRDLDRDLGKAYIGDGLATVLSGAGGGSGTTTYAENIGVMAATRVYSTAAYVVAGLTATLLGLCPKFGALILTLPIGVLGGATTVLYGLIAVLGARIWVESRVDFRDPSNLFPAAIALVIGAADYTWGIGDLELNGIALGTFAAIVAHRVMRSVGKATGALAYEQDHPVATPSAVPTADLGERQPRP
jgi:uracil-xanthine permease